MSCFINIGTTNGNLKNVKMEKPYQDIRVADVMDVIKEKNLYSNDVKIIGWSFVTPTLKEFYNYFRPKEHPINPNYLKILDIMENNRDKDLTILLPRINKSFPISLLETARALYSGKTVMIPFIRKQTRDNVLGNLHEYGITKFKIIENEKNHITIKLDGCD